MSDVPALTHYIKRLLALQPWFTNAGLTPGTTYLRNPAQIQDPAYPCCSLSYEIDKEEVFAPIAEVRLFVGFHAKNPNIIASVMRDVVRTLHNHRHADENVIIYKCLSVGAPSMPRHDAMLNTWESYAEFDVSTVEGEAAEAQPVLVVPQGSGVLIPEWISGYAYSKGTIVLSPKTIALYIAKLDQNESLVDPADDYDHWMQVGGGYE